MQQDLTLSQAQRDVDQWVRTVGVRYFSELTNLGQLVEEVGEVARVMIRTYGEQSSKQSDQEHDLGEELADVLFVVLCIANQTGVDLNSALQKSINKKTKRDTKRHQSNDKLKKQ